MCGVAGIHNLGNQCRPTRGELARMIDTMNHRGPDGTGFYEDGEIGLAHARLSIIDIAGGAQPIHNEDHNVQVILNGEIFNYLELRETLEQRGHHFYTHSDTEVIVHLYEDHGADFVSHLNGQFAIALWDKLRRRLLLARDRVGIRPLFYTQINRRLYFASEVKALFAHPDVPRSLDLHRIGDVFTYWSTISPATVFSGVHSIPAGHVLVADSGRVQLQQYWRWDFPEPGCFASASIDELVDELRQRLATAIRMQLRSDVPISAYLSGGLDSSLLTALMAAEQGRGVRTFSIAFESEEFDERQYQRALTEQLGLEHTVIECRERDIAQAFPQAIWHAETPILRTAPVPLMLLSQAVHDQRRKVVLTGEGADELFAGYDIFKEAQIRRFWSRQPDSIHRPRILQRLYPYLTNSPTSSLAYARRFFGKDMHRTDLPYYSHTPRWSTTQRTWRLFSQSAREVLARNEDYAAVHELLPADLSRWPPLCRDQYVEAHTLLSNYLLSAQGDRMSMANSVEGRYPFLDHTLIEFANRLPPRYKLMGLKEKYILKRMAADLVPDIIRRRPKQPYRSPDARAFFVDGRPVEYVADLLSPSNIDAVGYFDSGAVQKLLNKCAKGRAVGFVDNMAFVGILSTMLTDALFIQGAGGTHQRPPSEQVVRCQ